MKNTHRRIAEHDENDMENQAFMRNHRPRKSGVPSTYVRPTSWLRAQYILPVMGMLALFVYLQIWNFSIQMQDFPPLMEPFYEKTMVQFTTKFGTFTIDLYPDHAPKSVSHFMKLVDSGFYTKDAGFYLNEPKFVLQGGGYLAGKKSSLDNIPVEYSLPSEERMIVIARGDSPNSGNSEFAIMLHDNTETNRPSASSPGYTVFGRIVRGWHVIEVISQKMPVGFLSMSTQDQQISFTSVAYIKSLTHEHPEARKRLEELTYILETPHTIVIFSEIHCKETDELKQLFSSIKATVRTEAIGHSEAHPYERDAMAAIAETNVLPLVFINQKLAGGLVDIRTLQKSGELDRMLVSSGALAENIVWSTISSYSVVIFSKSFCPYCKKAKKVFAELGAPPFVIELDQREDGTAIQDFLFQITGRSTVPNVFIKGKSIGGSDDTQALYKSGELNEKLKKAGVI